jgi:hypothetical protein
MLISAIGAFLGALLTLLVSIFIEYQRKPKLSLSIENPPFDHIYPHAPARNARFIRAILTNKPMPRIFKWLGRSAAMQCSGEVQFHHFDGAPIFSRNMPIRWAGSDEPLTYQVIDEAKVALVFDVSKYNLAFKRDCYPGTNEQIDIAARFDDEPECYGWSNETYLPGRGWRIPDWKIPAGRYLVYLRVVSSGDSISSVFQMENSVTRDNFRLLPANKEETKNIKAFHENTH